MPVLKPNHARHPILILVAKAFQTPDVPRAAQEAYTLSKNHPVFVFAWDRYVEYPSWEVRGNVEVSSSHIGNLKKFSKLGLIFGGLIFQIAIALETVKLVKRLERRPIVIAHDINTLPVACFLKILGFASAVVYDCRELTFAIYSEWFNSAVGSFMSTIERKLLRYVRAVITVSDGIARYFARYNCHATVVYNCPKLSDVPLYSRIEARKDLGLPADDFIISCVTTLRYGCGLEILVEASKRLLGTHIRILIVGDGPLRSWLDGEASLVDKDHLVIVPRRPRSVALKYVKASDLTWVVYTEGSLNGSVGMPWKLFESIACGVPVVVEPNTLRSRFVQTRGCGIVLDNTNPIEVADAFYRLSTNKRGYNQIRERTKRLSGRYTWERESKKLLKILAAIN
jgi:glycosyltransferase involved in cell wall biosynthesis